MTIVTLHKVARCAVSLALAASAPSPAIAETVYLSEETDSRSDIVGGLENRRFNQPDLGAESIWAGAMNFRVHMEGNAAGAVDLALGGGPGYYYVARMMFGPAFALPGDGRVALVGGLGVSGLTDGRIGFGVELPIALEATIAVADSFRPTFVFRPAFLFFEDARQDGTRVGVIDEFDALLGLSFPSGRDESGDSGLYVGLDYGERMGGGELGFVVGASIGVPTSPASRERARLAQEQVDEDERQRSDRSANEAAQTAQNPSSNSNSTSSGSDSPPPDNFIVGVVAYEQGIKIAIIIVGDTSWIHANNSNSLRCGELYSEWSYQFSAHDLESARGGARALDDRMSKVGAHYEVWMKGDQCTTPTLVR